MAKTNKQTNKKKRKKKKKEKKMDTGTFSDPKFGCCLNWLSVIKLYRLALTSIVSTSIYTSLIWRSHKLWNAKTGSFPCLPHASSRLHLPISANPSIKFGHPLPMAETWPHGLQWWTPVSSNWAESANLFCKNVTINEERDSG